jgi:ComF family protein
MLDKILSIISPHNCKGCGLVGTLLCDRCIFNIIENKSYSTGTNFYSVGPRRGVLKKLTNDYKFHSQRAAADVLANLLDQIIPKLPQDTVIVPVPTASAHVRQYGFDHTALLAKKLARRRRLTVRRLLTRTNNQTQHFLSGQEREKSAKTAFALARPAAPVPPHILLLDDITTTGSTLRAARRLLARAGAKSIKIAVICYQSKNGI